MTAQQAYEAYATVRLRQHWTMPSWDSLGPDEHEAWEAVADKARTKTPSSRTAVRDSESKDPNAQDIDAIE